MINFGATFLRFNNPFCLLSTREFYIEKTNTLKWFLKILSHEKPLFSEVISFKFQVLSLMKINKI